MELIDFKKKGNAVRLYFGKNGEQWGDDWDDSPYECNAEEVDPKYVKKIYDMFVNISVQVEAPADGCINSPYSKEDFIYKKSWVLWISPEDYPYTDNKIPPVGIFLGDTLEQIKEKTKDYKPVFIEIEKVEG